MKIKSQKKAKIAPLKGPKIKPIIIQNKISTLKLSGPLKKTNVTYLMTVKTANKIAIKAISLMEILI